MRNPHLLLLACLLAGAACSPGRPGPSAGEAIPRDTFVQAYFQLRAAALQTSNQEIDTATRDSLLSSMGLTDQDLVDFVEVWGKDPDVMQGIWEEVDSMMRATRSGPALDEPRGGRGEESGRDTVRGPGGGPRG